MNKKVLSLLAVVAAVVLIAVFFLDQREPQQEPSDEQNPVSETSGINDQGIYENQALGFQLEPRSGVDIEVFNSNTNRLVIFKGDDLHFEVRIKKSDGFSLREYHFLDLIATGEASLGGDPAAVFEAPKGYCDGPSCSPPFVAYSALRGEDFYNLVFYGDVRLSEEEKGILSSFAFKK